MLLLPALATNSSLLSSPSSNKEYCEASGSVVPPMPLPPVLNVPAYVSEPSTARANATTALLATAFVCVNTAPCAPSLRRSALGRVDAARGPVMEPVSLHAARQTAAMPYKIELRM
jgi:hypothetical protein